MLTRVDIIMTIMWQELPVITYERYNTNTHKTGPSEITAKQWTQVCYIRITVFMTELSHWQRLARNLLVRRARVSLGNSKSNCCWQHFITSMLLVVNSFIKNLLITKSMDRSCDLFKGQATRPYRSIGKHLVLINANNLIYANSHFFTNPYKTVITTSLLVYRNTHIYDRQQKSMQQTDVYDQVFVSHTKQFHSWKLFIPLLPKYYTAIHIPFPIKSRKGCWLLSLL